MILLFPAGSVSRAAMSDGMDQRGGVRDFACGWIMAMEGVW